MTRSPVHAAWADLPALIAAPLGDGHAQLGEGPSWDPERGVVWWVDVLGHVLHATTLDGRDRAIPLQQQLTSVVLRASGGLVGTTPSGFVAIGPDDGAMTLLAAVEADDPATRSNDGKVDPAGRYWAGTMFDSGAPDGGSLYRLDADLSVHRLVTPVSCSNGLAWPSDGRSMYYIDTLTYRVDRFPWDAATGDLGTRTPWVHIPEGAGLPDGMTIDAEDHVWVALWDGWGVVRFAPDGTPVARIEVPVARTSSCCFAGPDLDTLAITTAQPDGEGDRAGQPLAGRLFAVRPGVRGRAPDAFRG
ncbi:MAG: SMP-30/gluconolactonase/LRE family protein [Chloroflexi bacterium]|nr:SMP-30/gluconolactonase/LRE family protein [Chloroflexota bacterium]